MAAKGNSGIETEPKWLYRHYIQAWEGRPVEVGIESEKATTVAEGTGADQKIGEDAARTRFTMLSSATDITLMGAARRRVWEALRDRRKPCYTFWPVPPFGRFA
jgi:hypothetical protein